MQVTPLVTVLHKGEFHAAGSVVEVDDATAANWQARGLIAVEPKPVEAPEPEEPEAADAKPETPRRGRRAKAETGKDE